MRLVFAGTPKEALPALEAVLASRHEVLAVLTRPDARTGRRRALVPAPVASRAAAEGLEVLTPVTPKEPAFLSRLAELAPDCCPVVAYGALLPQAALDIPRHGWVNLHFSILPAWRGAAPVQHALIAGDDVSGATTFRLVRELDAGPVYGVLTEPIKGTDTAGDLLDRLSHHGAGLLVQTLDGIEAGQLRPRPQPVEGVSLAPKLSADDARIDWSAPAFGVDRLVRACTPDPGAWTTFRGGRLNLFPVRLAPAETPELAPGELAVTGSDVLVGTGSGGVTLGHVQAPGRRRMLAAAWARGARPQPGERLGEPTP